MSASVFEVEFGAHPLRNQRGEIYHVIPAEICSVKMVARRRIGTDTSGKQVELETEMEAAFVRRGGAWLPPVFHNLSPMNKKARLCRQCAGQGVQEKGHIREQCFHCAGTGSISPNDEDFYAMLNAPVIHPISGRDCATHARQP